MKTATTLIEKLFTPQVLLAINVAIILVVEFAGGGTFFAETGLIHAIALLFVVIIVAQIFTDYAYSDYILKGFMKIQLAFLLFLGLVHVYEYFAEHVFMGSENIVGLTIVASYFVWLFSTFIALRFVFRIYYKKSVLLTAVLSTIVGVCFAGLIAPNVFPVVVAWFPLWFPKLILLGTVGVAILGIYYVRKIQAIMPIFREYSYYMASASILMVATSFFEYFESTNSLEAFGISEAQNLYLSHFLVFAALSLLIVGYNKIKKPAGIYAEK